MMSEIRKKALSAYKPPLVYVERDGLIFDDDANLIVTPKLYGPIQDMESTKELQNEAGRMVAEALNEYWGKNNGLS